MVDGRRVERAAAEPRQSGPVRIWIEGEAAESHDFNRHGWYSGDGIRLDWLSPGRPGVGGADGDWLAHYTDGGERASATYRFDVPARSDYRFWVRASVYRVIMRRSLDGGAVETVDTDSDVREELNMSVPGIDIRFLGWVDLGRHSLDPGTHTLRLSLDVHPAWGNPKVHGGIDAIAVVSDDWQPVGALRADAEPTEVPRPEDWFTFLPGDDQFSDASITDMSQLVEAPAGSHGHLRRDGDRFVFADGTPFKLWGVGASVPATQALREQRARFYRKHGINAVRLHPVEAVLGVLERDPDGARVLDPERLLHLDRWFATLKRHGIYMVWSPFYPHVLTPDDNYPPDLYAELPSQTGGKNSYGMATFMREIQDAQWEWLRTLLEHENEITGVRYVDDPALAIVETHNEDSVFWHFPLNELQAAGDYPLHAVRLQSMWAAWLRRQYASDSELFQAWGAVNAGRRPEDSLANDRPAIYGAWEMEADGPRMNKAETARMGDFIRFLAETQRSFYERRQQRLRDLGYRGVTVSTAWQAGGPAARAANLWTDTAMDAVDRHGYFGGGVGGHTVRAGSVNAGTHLAELGTGILDRGFEQVEDRPFLVSEWDQMPPNEYKAEIAPLMTFYGLGLHGWDGLLHFHSSSGRMRSGWPGLDSYVSETPHYFGQFPALALAAHRGDIATGAVAAARRIDLDDIFGGVDAFTHELPAGGYPGQNHLRTPPEVFAIGRVVAAFEPSGAAAERLDWADYSNPATDVVTSVTGELAWDRGRRSVQIRAPRTQGIIGFVGGTRHELPAVTIEVDTDFVSILVTSLDGRPIDESGHMLVTALARDRQLGANYSEDGQELLELGGPPLMLEPVVATLAFSGRPLTEVRAVDIYGVPTDTEVHREGNSFRIDGRYATYYYEVKTDAAPVVTPGTATATPGTPGTATATPGTPGTATATSSTPGTETSTAVTPVTATATSSTPETSIWLPVAINREGR